MLRMFSLAVQSGKRSIFVAPAEAIAEEKYTEFSLLAEKVKLNGGPEILISITTGDYQLTDDFLSSPPPDNGEIVICTPERLEVMLRNPENHKWAMKVAAYVF